LSQQLRSRIVYASLCCCLAQCGGASERSTLPPYRAPERPRSADDIALATAQCDYIERCDPDGMHVFAGSAKEACVDHFACDAARGAVPWRNAETARERRDACVRSLASRPCPVADVVPPERFSSEARFPWGSDCGAPDPTQILIPPPDAPKTGEACIDGFREQPGCQEGAYCAVEDERPAFGSTYCGVCAPTLELGQACTSNERCSGDARCVFGQCREPLPPGKPCVDYRECRFGSCLNGVCGPLGYPAEPYADVLDRACAGSTECGHQIGLRCWEGRCRPRATEGEACNANDGGCRLDQSCINGRCVALGCSLDLGEPCFAFCNEAECIDRVCKPPASHVGDRCSFWCGASLLCNTGSCQALSDRIVGSPCDFDQDCESGFCDRDLSAYCSRSDGCSIPRCDKCGTCASPPDPSSCR
jgi:hypothetical protein